MGKALLDFWQLHQTTLLLAFATFAVGTIAGFQGIVASIPSEWSMALRTFYGSCYIVTRGALPAIAYIGLHKLHLLNLTHPVVEALILGGGGETALRSRILLLFKSSAPGQSPTEESKGLLDVIFGLQKFFLDRAGNVLAKQRMEVVSKYYNKPGLKLEELTQSVDTNAGAVGNQALAARKAADETLQDYIKTKQQIAVIFDARTERNWCRKLGFALYEVLTIDNYHALSEEITK